MLRTTIVKAVRPAMATRTLATSARVMAAGDTGSPPKTGGQGDAFQRREKAAEDYAIRQREKEKLLELRKKIHEQQAHLKQLSDHMSVFLKSMEDQPPMRFSSIPNEASVKDFVLMYCEDRHGFPGNGGRDENPPFKERPTITNNMRKLSSDEITKDQGGEHN